MTVTLNTTVTQELAEEGLVREVIRAVQDYRKKLNLPIEKRVLLVLLADQELQEILVRFDALLREHVLLEEIRFAGEEEADTESSGVRLDKMEQANIEGRLLGMRIATEVSKTSDERS